MSAGGRTASRAAASPTGILTQPLNAPEESPPDGSLVHGGRPVSAGHHPDGQAHVHARQGRRTGPAEQQGTEGCRLPQRRRDDTAGRQAAGHHVLPTAELAPFHTHTLAKTT